VHAIARVLDSLPKRLQPTAKKLLHEIMEAPSRANARLALERLRAVRRQVPQGAREARSRLAAPDGVR
jgi:hypothetical protein